jgi:hypothetical protein
MWPQVTAGRRRQHPHTALAQQVLGTVEP